MVSRIQRQALLYLSGVFAIVFGMGPVAPAADQKLTHFISRRGDQLYDGDQLYRFISFNIPNLMVIEDAYGFTRPSPWRWPNEFEIEDALESVRQMGGQVVRTYVLSVYRDGSDMGDLVHVRKPGKFNEDGFCALDKVLEVANRKGIRIIVPLVDHAKWWGGLGEYAAFRGKPPEAFWSDPQIIDDFKATIRYLLERRNTYTGVRYRDDPALFGWETGNEIAPPPQWTRQIAAYIKQLDKNHLVVDGQSLEGFPSASLDDPNVDVISTHHYPFGTNHDFVASIRAAHARTKGKKPYFVGEFGFVETPHVSNAIQAVIDEGISGALLWSLRMHRREGGFYWHMEVGTGKNIYKAFHWPGFDSGQRYDERAIVTLMREKAYEIRGMRPPARERPAPPTLLPIEAVNAISWRGSAGASGYDIWRTTAEDGCWERIATNVSDAEVQYRPLFNDDQVEVGNNYWYRVVARNSAGESEASNVVGPVLAKCRTLVDECRDLSLTAATAGNVTTTSENARSVQEDCHRLALQPGAEIVYRVGGPIKNWTVYAFARNEAKLKFATGSNTFQVAKSESNTFPSTHTIYGYLTPVLYTGNAEEVGATALKISFPPGANPPANDGRTKGSMKPPRIELARVEIEFANSTQPAEEASDRCRAAQLNSTVFIEAGRPIDETLRTIDEAAQHGERQLNVVVSILVDLTDDLKIDTFGAHADEAYNYEFLTDETREAFRDDLRRVFKKMAQRQLGIFILPHIDAGGRVQQWRNWVDFDPLIRYGDDSYQSLVLNSIADALVESIQPTTPVELALSGEMGTSLFKYPQSYREIVRRLRARPELRAMKIGVSLNHDGIGGRGNPTGAPDIVLAANQRKDLQALIDECDFIGISSYFPVRVPPVKNDFVRGIDRFMNELSQFGLSVPPTKPLHFSEIGIGGGRLQSGSADATKVAQTPWEGAHDLNDSAWRDPMLRNLRRQYHTAVLDFLSTQPAQYRVSAAFLWSTGPWDPWGYRHPEFADSTITTAIERHNRSIKSPP